MMAFVKQQILGGRESVQVAIAQISPAFMDPAASAQRAVEAITEAASSGADLVVFPEVWLAGYPYWTEGWDSNVDEWVAGRVRFADAAIVIPGEISEQLSAAAREAGVYVVMGCNELDSRPGCETIYNTLLFLGRDGQELGRHRKLMPTFTERMFWGGGDAQDLVVFETDIGRAGGLICGEHLMTLVRAATIAQGEHIHIAAFPGSFALHTGPQLEEPDTEGNFWGHFSCRAHAMEAGTFVLCACGYLDEDDVPDDFPYKGRMNTTYAHGGSAVFGPLGVPLVPPTYGPQIIYAELPAAMIKATKAIVDTIGHYGRPDVLKLLVHRPEGWTSADILARPNARVDRDALRRAAESHDAEEELVGPSVAGP